MNALDKPDAFERTLDGVPAVLRYIRGALGVSQNELSRYLGTSLLSVARLERGDGQPSPDMTEAISALHADVLSGRRKDLRQAASAHVFASRGARSAGDAPLFESRLSSRAVLSDRRQPAILDRLSSPPFWGEGQSILADILSDHEAAAPSLDEPSPGGVSAGKNTYTYDAHTYHTKVPPQGIAEILKQYLPEGGVVLDPFAGSGMTGVAAMTLGYDIVLNELSPAASFISDRFTRSIDPRLFAEGVRIVCEAVADVRRDLYTTECRECSRSTEILHTIWSYKVKCPKCHDEFVLWDHCRKYGRNVKEHKILSEFSCPCCKTLIKKSRLERTVAVPVMVGYKCCRPIQMEHPLNEVDRTKLDRIEHNPPLAYGDYPTKPLPDGVNLNQPKRHGLTTVDSLYTTRNLVAMSHLWRAVNRVADAELAGYLAFAFTSLYQRVTRMSEFRFWGGSGNTANYNVPYIFNEANVFKTFERKARTIQDHLGTTARHYRGRCIVRTGSATDLSFLPSNSVDIVFTDPPFGANINYSEMNVLWESWLERFTDTDNEAIVNKYQGKDASRYGELMRQSLAECCRVLRPGRWMLLVFMNSSQSIWEQLQQAIVGAGFSLERMDIFDKQHGTFKHYVSDNTPGADLILHCRKPVSASAETTGTKQERASVSQFLIERKGLLPKLPFLHVSRDEEIDYRMLYSEWLAEGLLQEGAVCGFPEFRHLVAVHLNKGKK